MSLKLEWTIGSNNSNVNSVHDISTADHTEIFYASANVGVVYNANLDEQTLLQGHANSISATACSKDRNYLISADVGLDSKLVVYNRQQKEICKVWSNPHKEGVIALAVSPFGHQIASLSVPLKVEESHDNAAVFEQILSIWDWDQVEEDSFIHSSNLLSTEVQSSLVFNNWNSTELVSTGKRRVVFWQLSPDRSSISHYSPTLVFKDFKQKVAPFTCSVFLAPNGRVAGTGTTEGDVIVWDANSLGDGLSSVEERRAVKVIRLCNSFSTIQVAVSIDFLKAEGEWVVAGSSDGAVRIYDFQFRLKVWYESLHLGAIRSVSFLKPGDVDGPFIFATDNGTIAQMIGNSSTSEKKILQRGLDAPVVFSACHPRRPHLLLCCLSGSVQVWNYEKKSLVSMKSFDRLIPSCCSYSDFLSNLSDDHCLMAIGFSTGFVKIFNSGHFPVELATLRGSREKISYLKFSGKFLAAVHEVENSLCLFSEDDGLWSMIGKLRSHWRRITGLCFSEVDRSIITIGEDKRIILYGIKDRAEGITSPVDSQLLVGGRLYMKSVALVSNEEVPRGCFLMQEKNIVQVFDSDFKIRKFVIGSQAADLSACCGVSLGPVFYENGGGRDGKVFKSSPVVDIKQIPNTRNFYSFSTDGRFVGVLRGHSDCLSIGNSSDWFCMQSLPEGVSSHCVDFQGKFLFFSGPASNGIGGVVTKYKIDSDFIAEKSIEFPEKPSELVFDDETKIFEEEFKNYFYLCQIRAAGENTTQVRFLDGKIPVSEIENFFCAFGFYPSNFQISVLDAEIGNFSKDKRISFQEACRLFLNHRPVRYRFVTKKLIQDNIQVLLDCNRKFDQGEANSRPADDQLNLGEDGIENFLLKFLCKETFCEKIRGGKVERFLNKEAGREILRKLLVAALPDNSIDSPTSSVDFATSLGFE